MDMGYELPRLTQWGLDGRHWWIGIAVVTMGTPLITLLGDKYTLRTLRITGVCLFVSFLLTVTNITAFSLPVIEMASVVNQEE